MTPQEALQTLRDALPAKRTDNESIGVPGEALRVLTEQRVFFCACGARRHAVDIRGPGETLLWPDNYAPGDYIDPCTCGAG